MKRKEERKASKKRAKRLSNHLEHVNLYAAGIDVGSQEHFVAVPEDLDTKSVRSFSCFTGDLKRLAEWLVSIGIQTVALESTGIYWIPVFEILEEHGLEVLLVDARRVKNVSGRKSDVSDCQWLQQLHTYGLLASAFRPPEMVCALRSYLRQRDNIVSQAATHIQHMQKALRQMNLLLDNVISDITGVTGMKIIRAILAGERDPKRLAQYRDGRCKNSIKVIEESLHGHYRDEHLFALRQAVELYDIYQAKISACDQAIEQHLKCFESQADPCELPKKSKRKHSNAISCDVRSHLFRMTGVDVTQIDGFDESIALKVVSETGTDMDRWKTKKHFSSWLGLSPGNKISGGKVLSSRTKKTANRATQAFRMAAYAVANSKSALGAYYRRMRARVGGPKAITATAHKIAHIFYSMLKHGTAYVDQGQDYYEKHYHNRMLKNLRRKAADLGYSLIPEKNELEPVL